MFEDVKKVEEALMTKALETKSFGAVEVTLIIGILKKIADSVEFGKMSTFRTKDSTGQWEKGGKFQDKDFMMLISFDDFVSVIVDIFSKKSDK